MSDWQEVRLIRGPIIALYRGCTCEASCGEECACPDAVWFHRYERDNYMEAGDEE